MRTSTCGGCVKWPGTIVRRPKGRVWPGLLRQQGPRQGNGSPGATMRPCQVHRWSQANGWFKRQRFAKLRWVPSRRFRRAIAASRFRTRSWARAQRPLHQFRGNKNRFIPGRQRSRSYVPAPFRARRFQMRPSSLHRLRPGLDHPVVQRPHPRWEFRWRADRALGPPSHRVIRRRQ
jgi:hypothetical protein